MSDPVFFPYPALHILKPPPQAFKYGTQSVSANHYRDREYMQDLSTKFGGLTKNVLYPPEGGMLCERGAKYPTKGIPYPEALLAINAAKGMLLIWIKNFNPFNWKSTLELFINSAHKVIAPHVISYQYCCPVARAVYDMTYEGAKALNLDNRGLPDHHKEELLADILSTVFEYEDAYRGILQDAVSEWKLEHSPAGEVKRIARLVKSRWVGEPDNRKFEWSARVFSFILLLPKYKRLFERLLMQYRSKLLPDAGDLYWMGTKTYYNFQGIPYAQRFKATGIQ